MTGTGGSGTRLRAALEARLLGLLVSVSDLLPSGLRYGHLRTISQTIFGHTTLPSLTDGSVGSPLAVWPKAHLATGGPRVTLVTGRLDLGGLENVVRMLAEGLGEHGLVTSVLCTDGGATHDALLVDGVEVAVARTRAQATSELRRLRPDVIQVHNAPEPLMQAVEAYPAPFVVVIHNAEVHRSAAAWADLATSSAACWIAVSESARDFHLHHLPVDAATRVVVVPNAAPGHPLPRSPGSRAAARTALGEKAGWSLGEADVVVVSLARFDAQKNIPGLIAGFMAAAAERPTLRLAVAGPTADWLEVARADAIRRSSDTPHAAVLLGPSSSDLLLAAADAFVLDSFFEGGPIVAVEAARAGLPVILSDVGIGRELLGGTGRGVLVGNPATSSLVDERAIRTARRRSVSQRNTLELRKALVDLADQVGDWRDARGALASDARSLFTAESMLSGHAGCLKAALAARSLRDPDTTKEHSVE